jgi:4a-hydroxytetrahydrobiopterin dehydratase
MERGPDDRFSLEEVESKLSNLSGWKFDATNGSISKTYTRANFLDAAAFIQKAAEIAESQDHHPDVFLHAYKKLTFTLSTHSAGGVTQNDIDLATALDQAA